MVAIELWHNGRKLTTAGAEDMDLLLAILRWRLNESGGDEADIEICGQTEDNRHLVWREIPIKTGDEILLRLVNVGDKDVDEAMTFSVSDFPQVMINCLIPYKPGEQR